MPDIAVAASSQLAADAGRTIARAGGNAVDGAIAATLVAACTEPFVMAPGGGGFITLWPPGGEPVTIDAYGEVPGRGLPGDRVGQAIAMARFDYGGETQTGVGYGAIATPGLLAGLAMAAARYGRLPWDVLLQPAIAAVEAGFPLPPCAAEYIAFAHDAIFAWHPASRAIIYRPDGRPLQLGDRVAIPALAASLRRLAADGPATLYGGDLGQRICAEIQDHGGCLTLDDLRAYRPIARSPLQVSIGDWTIATNPPPAVGGACLAAMLLLLAAGPIPTDGAGWARQMAEVQRAVLHDRGQRLDGAGRGLERAVTQLLDAASTGNPGAIAHLKSPSTIHTSAVDRDGFACSISASAGYGSGAMPGNTGLWMNNALGELELNPHGLDGLRPGDRLTSNMAPTILRHRDGTVHAIGSPGASRITTALAQVAIAMLRDGDPPDVANGRSRLHLEIGGRGDTLSHEPGIDTAELAGFRLNPFERQSMYFGGVQMAGLDAAGTLYASSDRRRAGGTVRPPRDRPAPTP